MMNLANRIAKLESAVRRSNGGVVVLTGYSSEEHRRKIDELKASDVDPDSLFVCIMRFTDANRALPPV